jgi:2-methylisocitrate lyase-like PEP mutase family enzyme
VTAIQLEDQVFPKKTGSTARKLCIKPQEMVRKIQVALDTRESDDFLIVARTDARSLYGEREALKRLELYALAGADVLFYESPKSEVEMRRACDALDTPLMVNMAHGGRTPILPSLTLADIGVAFAIYPSLAGLAAARAIREMFGQLIRGEVSKFEPALENFKYILELLGYSEIESFESRWNKNAL